jgi:hypothetical protein
MSKQTTMARARKLGLAGVAGATALAAGWAMAGPALASQTATAKIDGTTLTVTGTGDAERIALRLTAGDANQLEVDFGDDGSADFTFNRAGFNQIVVLALGGADQFRVDGANGDFTDEALTVDGGRGDDILNGGRGIETFYGRGGTDTVDGNQGNDTGYMGSGDDSFRWDPGDGSDIVEGERGFDTLDFNGSNTTAENMRLSPVGGRSLFFRDAGNINMDMDDVERVDLTLLGLVDTFTLENMSGTDFKVADVDLSEAAGGPDGAADTVTVNGSARGDEISVDADGPRVTVEGLKVALNLSGSEVTDTLQINGLEGDDEVSVADAVAALITPSIDLGADED